ncbi:MAG TPA: PEP-CTERM sorting domain-containing protein [Leptolyngbyaceae cyanobacterium M33_DOE_097]|uniref:PEP-CTERM sorting domain-containing protein n=1 Tax=Oscillatoriales cyanobacterium SpSt-418 TaxID=2282169 RepID=A0A7C3PM99_9CYAN|nr:PEP-CTERM sorting domain-containing protein [Leptolyngbyaceae cyanobacterium M33_DOE_097]
MNRLTKRPASEKTTQRATSIALGAIGLSFVAMPVQAASFTLQEVTEASVTFAGEYSVEGGASTPFTSVGTLKYSNTPLEGTFYFAPLTFLFVSDPADLPEDFFPISAFSVVADDDFRLVTEFSFDFPTSSYLYTSDLTSGSTFNNVLLFKPASTPTFPSGDGALLNISIGDPRRPELVIGESWFLGDISASPERQLSIFADGSFIGFDQAPPGSSSPTWLAGSWRATAVPEPFSVLGTAMALIGGAYLKRQPAK